MDFHSLTRKELQSLCKQNKIPANLTNVAMANALQSLDIVEGIEGFLNVSHSETASNVIESVENIELLSPKAPQTRCRTSTRQKVKKTETENLPPPTVTRTTRRAAKQLVDGVKDELKTPGISRTTGKALSCLNVEKQQSLVDQKMEESVRSSPETVVTNSLKKETAISTVALKQEENNLQEMKTYSRRSTKLTEKKSAEPILKKDSEENVSTVESGVELEDICNAFEKLDVMPVVEKIDQCPVLETVVDEESAHKSEEESEHCGELDSLNMESEEAAIPCEKNGYTDAENDQVFDISTICAEEKLDQKIELEDEKFDASVVKDLNLDSNGSSTMASDMIIECTDHPIESFNSENENNVGDADELITKETEQVSANTVNESFDVIPADVDNDSTVIEDTKPVSVNTVNETFDDIPDVVDNDSTLIEDTELVTVNTVNETYTVNETFAVIPTVVDKDYNVIEDTEVVSVNTANETSDAVDNDSTEIEEAQDLKRDLLIENKVNKKADAHSDGNNQFFVFSPCLPIEHNDGMDKSKNVTPIKKEKSSPLKNMTIVSNDKENIDCGRKLPTVFMDDGKNKSSKKETDESERLKSYNDMSMRQLRKQLKALTLQQSLNSNEDNKVVITTRPALQAICENKMVGSETKN